MKTHHFIDAVALSVLLISSTKAVSPPPDGGYGRDNTAEGEGALFSLTFGSSHTAVGYHALYNLRQDFGSTVIGSLALSNTGDLFGSNIAIGFQTLLKDRKGYNNVAVGVNALLDQRGTLFGFDNGAIGANALRSSINGVALSAVGSGARRNGRAGNCVVLGYNALRAGAGGGLSVVAGRSAYYNGGGLFTVALGAQVLSNLADTSEENIAIGFGAGRGLTGNSSDNIDIGNAGNDGDNGVIRIGEPSIQRATFIAGINGVTIGDGTGLLVSREGQLGTVTSSARYKEAIRPIERTSEVLYLLQPVTFRYKRALDPDGIRQFGLVAEEVAKVAPELAVYDSDRKPCSVRYSAINAMLLNEFQKDSQRASQEAMVLKARDQKLADLDVRTAKVEAKLAANAEALSKLEVAGTH